MSLVNFVTKISPFGTGFIACRGRNATWAQADTSVAHFCKVEAVAGAPAYIQLLFWEDPAGLAWSRQFSVVDDQIHFLKEKQPVTHTCQNCGGTGEIMEIRFNPSCDGPSEYTEDCPDCDGEGEL